MHIYKYVQAHIILHQNVSVTPVTIIRVFYNKDTKDIQIKYLSIFSITSNTHFVTNFISWRLVPNLNSGS